MPENDSAAKLLIASNNKHKSREINEIFEKRLPGRFQLLTPADVGLDNFDVEETGSTLEENALLKARAFFERTNLPSFADDTGLEIDYLKGAPGVYSARFSGDYGNDAANRAKVLSLMSTAQLEQRTARFRTVISFFDGKQAQFVTGSIEGLISFNERGSAGFGYDPIFVPAGSQKTFAEMTPDEKNSISHRARAILALVEHFEKKI